MKQFLPSAGAFRVLLYSLAAFLLAIASCKRPRPVTEVDPAFAQYIASFTSGTISKKSPIRIVLSPGHTAVMEEGATLPASLFEFTPAIKGSAVWAGPRTIEFRPAENLKPGQLYEVAFDLSAVKEVPEAYSSFRFGFEVITPSFEVLDEGLWIPGGADPAYMQYKGQLLTADMEDAQEVKKLLSASYEGKQRSIQWQHFPEEKTHHFIIDSLQRGEAEKQLQLKWNGEVINADLEGSKELAVPEKDAFKVLDIRSMHQPEQYVLLQFSQPISSAQSLEGMISLSGLSDLRYTVDGSEVKVYAPDLLEGNYQVKANEGIKSTAGARMDKTYSAEVSFENRMPSVEIAGRGVILPQSGKLVLPFEAVNLNAVDVTIIKIYENNIPQFLQQNDLASNYNLRAVARPVVQETIWLNKDESLNLKKKNRFSLDIDKLVKTEPGAIYTVTIGFRKSYSLYGCDGESQETTAQRAEEIASLEDLEDDEFWSRYDRYYPYGYNWKERDNPCHDSYYNKRRWATRNVIASNLGLIAKREAGNVLKVTVTDIISAEPMKGVELELLDYQQQVLATASSDGEGMAQLDPGRKPFLLIARKGDQRAYLKLDDGSSLPLSRFDIGGGQVQKGLKGYIYGERGVWRPGDSLFITFMLEDKAGTLPEEHPVSFEVYNPRGQLFYQTIKSKSENGFYTFPFATGQDAPTGNWTARVKVGGAEFSKLLKIETVMPNRLKIDLDFKGRKALSNSDEEPIGLSARWLFGGIAENLKASVNAYLSHDLTSFASYEDYIFDDPAREFSWELKTVFEDRLSPQGEASFTPDFSVENGAPGMLKANFLVKVFEPGGNFSIDRRSIPYHLYDSYVGIKVPEGEGYSGFLVTGQDHPVDIVNVNREGKALSGRQKVKVELYKIKWRWWWDESGDNLSNFTQDSYNKLLQRDEITLNNGKGEWKLRVDQPDWGRYLLRVTDLESGHITGQTVYIDWPGWSQRMRDEYPAEAAMLSFTANKEQFQVGEEVVLTVPSSEGGRCLVSIESGSKVLKSFWADTEEGQTLIKFKVDEAMAPNVYVNISLLQPHSHTLNDLPIRMYGVIPLMVESPETKLKPVINMPSSIRPEQASSLTVSEASGKPMTYTLAIVDEGLLDLTRFATPDPHAAFYAREALGVKTWDLFDEVVGAWGGDLERILSIGGDGELNRDANTARANRFKPVVKFMGPFRLKKGQQQKHDFKLDPYIGSVRVMVVAGDQGAYGMEEKAVAVKKPLMLLATLPRVLAPGEKVQMPVTVFSTASGQRDVSLRVSSNELLKPLNAADARKTVHFDQPGEQLVYIEMEAASGTGIAKVAIEASSGNEKASYEVELDVRNPNPVITKVIEKEIAPGETVSADFEPIGTSDSREAWLELSSIPAINLSKHLTYLINYPHGCVEQVTSGVFPQLVLEQLTDLTERQKAEISRNVKHGISRLSGFQLSNGGLGYWAGSREPSEWGTNYAGHFLLEAKEKGYSVPEGLLTQWTKFQRNKASSWAPSTYNFRGGDLLQAYRLFLLAKAGQPEMGAMNRLREFNYLSPVAKWLLASAYHMAGQAEAANALVSGLSSTELARRYDRPGFTFGSVARDQAIVLQAQVLMGRRDQARRLLNDVARNISANSWYSTQTTAWSLIAIAGYCGNNTSENKLQANYSFNGKEASLNSEAYLSRIPLALGKGQQHSSLRNTGNNQLFARWVISGQPLPGEAPPVASTSGGLQMAVRYKTLSGESINPEALLQGSDFIAEVTITNPDGNKDLSEMTLAQVFPSGWEIINTRLSGEDNVLKSSPFVWQDIRDDRVYTYFDLKEGRSVTYHVMLNAAYAGSYYLPPVACEAMYDAGISAWSEGKWVRVKALPSGIK